MVDTQALRGLGSPQLRINMIMKTYFPGTLKSSIFGVWTAVGALQTTKIDELYWYEVGVSSNIKALLGAASAIYFVGRDKLWGL